MKTIIESKITYIILAILLIIVISLDMITTYIGVELIGLKELNKFSEILINNGLFYPIKLITLSFMILGLSVGTKVNKKLQICLITFSSIAIIIFLIIDILNLIGLLI